MGTRARIFSTMTLKARVVHITSMLVEEGAGINRFSSYHPQFVSRYGQIRNPIGTFLSKTTKEQTLPKIWEYQRLCRDVKKKIEATLSQVFLQLEVFLVRCGRSTNTFKWWWWQRRRRLKTLFLLAWKKYSKQQKKTQVWKSLTLDIFAAETRFEGCVGSRDETTTTTSTTTTTTSICDQSLVMPIGLTAA